MEIVNHLYYYFGDLHSIDYEERLESRFRVRPHVCRNRTGFHADYRLVYA